MEGLMKGLLNVALDAALGNNNNDDNDNNDRDERSRSTWAQVVSGEEEEKAKGHGYSGGGSSSHSSNNRWSQKEDEGRNEESESAGQRHSRKPQRQEVEGEENSEGWEAVGRRPQKQHQKLEENNEDWETVGRKPQKQPHKVLKDNWNGFKRPSNEQNYSDDVEYGASLEPTEEELSALSEACNKLWELDSNRLIPNKDYQIECGEGKKTYQKVDMAQGSLFYSLNEDVFRRPTYSRFCSLLDNYNPNEGVKEVVTSEEREEQQAFIEEISRTAPIKYLYKYLKAKGVVSGSDQNFKKLMLDLWFTLYGRGGSASCSSAFEHVFVGEIKQQGEDAVSGFHNWLQFYLEEAKGKVDYQGYIFPRRRGETPDAETQLLSVQFEWNGVLKTVSSTLVGVSPEFEIALYTLCFFMGGEDNYVQLGPYSVNIKCYRLGNDKIGSVFPIAE